MSQRVASPLPFPSFRAPSSLAEGVVDHLRVALSNFEKHLRLQLGTDKFLDLPRNNPNPTPHLRTLTLSLTLCNAKPYSNPNIKPSPLNPNRIVAEEKYRSEIELLRAENERLKSSQTKTPKKTQAETSNETLDQLKSANEALKKVSSSSKASVSSFFVKYFMTFRMSRWLVLRPK